MGMGRTIVASSNSYRKTNLNQTGTSAPTENCRATNKRSAGEENKDGRPTYIAIVGKEALEAMQLLAEEVEPTRLLG